MVSWSAGMRPSTACATTPASSPRQRSSTNERALVAAGHSGVISVPFGGNTTSKTSQTPSLTWISAARSGRVGEVAQDRRDPFDQEGAAGIVGRPVDRAGRLRIGAGEVERDALALLDHLQRELVQLRIGDAVVLDVVLPGRIRRRRSSAAARCDRCRGTCRGWPGSRPPPCRARSARTAPPCGARPSRRPAPRCRDRRRASRARGCCA